MVHADRVPRGARHAGRADDQAAVSSIEARTIEIPSGRSNDSPDDSWQAVDAARIADEELTTWDEAVERAVIFSIPAATEGVREYPLAVPGSRNIAVKHGPAGSAAARVVRECWPMAGRVCVGMVTGGATWKITIRVENLTPWNGVADRAVALRQSLVGAHTLLAVEDGAFLSLQDPPNDMRELARSCVNIASWPVLAGSDGSRDVILSAPIILSDYPAIAPESGVNLFDSTEIDELLTLRVLTLTDGEKREARATDERTRRIIERADLASAETSAKTLAEALAGLHGAFRDPTPATRQQDWEAMLNPPSEAAPEHATLDIPGACVAMGSRVRLKPKRRADPIDLFLEGRSATVMGVYRTLENQPFVAVTIDDDPARISAARPGVFSILPPTRSWQWSRTPMADSVLVAGIGNIFRADDGFGPAVAARLTALPLPMECGCGTSGSGACIWPTSCSMAAINT